jgi:hypothetical protein
MSEKTTVSTDWSTERANKSKEEKLVEAVAEDQKLTPDEKETVFRFAKDEDTVGIYTEEGGLMRRLIQHPKFRLESLRTVTKETWGKHVDPDDFNAGSITGVDGWAPVSVLSLKTSSRKTSQHAAIVPDRVLREG